MGSTRLFPVSFYWPPLPSFRQLEILHNNKNHWREMKEIPAGGGTFFTDKIDNQKLERQNDCPFFIKIMRKQFIFFLRFFFQVSPCMMYSSSSQLRNCDSISPSHIYNSYKHQTKPGAQKKRKKKITRMQQKYSRMRRENSTIADLFTHNWCCGLQNFTSVMFFKSFHTFLRKLFFTHFYLAQRFASKRM